nr:MAG TPA: hypothetical protein [Bacteriophage sp.]
MPSFPVCPYMPAYPPFLHIQAFVQVSSCYMES